MSTLTVRLTRRVVEAQDIVSFELCTLDGSALPAFDAGAHIDVHVRDGLIRQYSLCNDPAERHRYLIAVLRDPQSRGGSIAMHALVEGGTLQIGAPKNLFPLVAARHSLLFAGGIGVTPILSMAESLAKAGSDFAMHYCSRSLERTAFHRRIADAAFAGNVQFHFDAGAPEQRLDIEAVLAEADTDTDTHLYVCGPGGYIDFIVNAAKQRGWSGERIHFEYFAGAAQDESADRPFDVKLSSSGKTYTIPVGKSVISVLAENGVELPIACEKGVCGTCITRVVEGIPDHRDLYFTDEERAANDQFTPCCSRAKSAVLVLDV